MSNTVVNTNILALNSHRSLRKVGVDQSRASARLSSGMKINSGADDAAGLAISEKMRSQIRGLDMASKNAQDAISLIQTAEGGLAEINNMIQRVRELTVQASNDTNQKYGDTTPVAATDTFKLAKEASQLVLEIDAMSARTEFNKKKLLTDSDGSSLSNGSNTFHMQVGANANQSLNVVINHITASRMSITDVAENIISGASTASTYLTRIDEALRLVTEERANLGAFQNRLEYTIQSLDITSENTSASESRIRDADMAREMMNITKANVLQQAATSMLAQANQAPQNVLQLLR